MEEREDLYSFFDRVTNEAEEAFVPAGVLWRNRFKTYKLFKTWLDSTPVRQRKPRKNRLEIHAGDWDHYWHEREAAAFAKLDDSEPPAITENFVEEAKQRAAEVRAANVGKRRGDAPPLDALIKRIKDKR